MKFSCSRLLLAPKISNHVCLHFHGFKFRHESQQKNVLWVEMIDVKGQEYLVNWYLQQDNRERTWNRQLTPTNSTTHVSDGDCATPLLILKLSWLGTLAFLISACDSSCSVETWANLSILISCICLSYICHPPEVHSGRIPMPTAKGTDPCQIQKFLWSLWVDRKLGDIKHGILGKRERLSGSAAQICHIFWCWVFSSFW